MAVFEELHFHRAAERLGIAQPPLSQAIRKLESELGVSLFERTSRVVNATDAGHVLATEARKVLAAFDSAVVEARRARGATSPLRIGCVPYLPTQALLRFLDPLHEQDPDAHVRVTRLDFLEQVRRLAVDELELGIFHATDTPGIEFEPLFVGEPLAAFLPPDHPLADKRVLRAEDVRNETLIFFPRAANPALNDRLLDEIEEAGYRFAAVREAGGTNPRDVMLAVAEGLGVAFGPVSLQEESHIGSIVVRLPLEPELVTPDMVVAWRTDPPVQLSKTLAQVREIAKSMHDADTRD